MPSHLPAGEALGLGFVFDKEGRVKLCPESDEYRNLLGSGEVKVLRTMSSSRR